MPERYEIKGKIARGGIGAIYRAQDTVMGREVAIKRLLPIEETHLNESAAESLQREAAALARFQHPNVISIYAFEEDDEGRFVVMEFVDGETLKETVTKAALPVEDFVELTLQVLDPLIAARDLNLLHRDIKPSNIMMAWLPTGRFQVKMLDFGLAKFSQKPSTQTLDQTGSFLGSIDYLAPEQLDLQKLDQRTDLYSLGCVLYYCLTQSPPFEGENAAQTMRNHLTHQVTPLQELRPDLPAALAAWVMRMIARYPNQRPKDAGVALEEFQAARKQGDAEQSGEGVDPPPLAILLEETPEVPPAEAQIPPEERSKTGPRLVTGEKRPRTQPQLLVPQQERTSAKPVMNTSGPEKERKNLELSAPRKSDPKRRAPSAVPPRKSKGWVPLTLLGILALLGLLWYLADQEDGARKDTDDRSDEAAATDKGTLKKASGTGEGAKSSRKRQARNPEANAATIAPELPIKAGLVGHYSASDFTFGTDLRKEAGVGDSVLAWANLAPEVESGHLMAFQANQESATPVLRELSTESFPELNGSHRVLEFSQQTTLEAQGKSQIRSGFRGKGFTCFLVMRTESPQASVLRFSAPGVNPASSLSITQRGYSGTVREGKKWQNVSVQGPKDRFVVVSLTRRAEDRLHQVHLRLPDGKRLASKPLQTEPASLPIDGYRIGHLLGPNAKQTARTFAGWVAELVIYGEPLSDGDRKELEDHLYRRYFAP